MLRAVIVVASILFATPALADKSRVLVLPLAQGNAVGADVARAFDARLLVALEETGRVVTVTATEEPDCSSMRCLAAAGTAAGASHVLSLAVVREDGALTLFGTLIDSATAATARRAELSGLTASALGKSAPAEMARRIAGTAQTTAIVGVALPASGAARTAASSIADRLAALRTFGVVAIDKSSDRSMLTHRAEIAVTTLEIVQQVHHVHRYLDGVLVGTLSITDLADGSTLYRRTVKVTVSRRFRYSSRAEVTALLVEAAVQDWMSGFFRENVEARLTKGQGS